MRWPSVSFLIVLLFWGWADDLWITEAAPPPINAGVASEDDEFLPWVRTSLAKRLPGRAVPLPCVQPVCPPGSFSAGSLPARLPERNDSLMPGANGLYVLMSLQL